MSVELHLFVPGLLPPSWVDAKQLSGYNPGIQLLETWLSRADKITLSELDYYRQLLALSKINWIGSESAPIAPIARLGDRGEPDSHYWVAATPAHFAAEGDKIVLYGGGDIKLDDEEAQNFVTEFNSVYGGDGWFLEARTPLRWYLRSPQHTQVQLADYDTVVGNSISDHLPQGADAKSWLSLFNEIQMLFHGSELNQHRQMKGLPTINGVWLWGNGLLPEIKPNWQQVWSDESMAQGLAKLSGVSPSVLPSSAEDCIGKLVSNGSVLITTRSLSHVESFRDPEAWEAKFSEFISEWLPPLTSALKSRDIECLKLYPGGNVCFRLDASLLRRFWRVRKSIARFV